MLTTQRRPPYFRMKVGLKISHFVLGVIFLCQKFGKALFSLCFFLEKGILATTTPPAPRAESRNSQMPRLTLTSGA
jgi:hypothetical protein